MTHQWMSRVPLVSWLTLALLVLVLACGPAATPVPEPTVTPAPPPPATGSPALAETEEPAPAPVSVPVQQNAPPPVPMEVPTSTLAPTPTPTPSPKVTAVPTPTPEPIPTRTPTPTATATPEPTAVPTPVPTQLPEPPTLEAQVNYEENAQENGQGNGQAEEPTETPPLIHCLTKPDGTELCRSFKPDPPGKYPELLSMNKDATRAEIIRSQGTRSADVPVAIVWIKMSTEAQGVALEEWLATKGLTEYDWSMSEALDFYKNNRSGIFSASDGEVFAVMPADWLIDISKREGFVIVEPGCQVTRCVGYGQ